MISFSLGLVFWAFAAAIAILPLGAAPRVKTENVFLIISDGLRWQEVFAGAEAQLMTKENGGVKNTNSLRAEFWRETSEARRAALLPFFWGEIARRGQIFGNQNQGSIVSVTNGKKFSYPGYNEMLAGFADPRIDSNSKKPNPNVTVFEWLNGHPRFQGRVGVLGTWDVFPYIFNCGRSRLPVWPAWDEHFAVETIRAPAAVAELVRDTTRAWEGVIYDSFLFHTAIDYLKRGKPRAAFLGFGETDEWAHAGRYDLYLAAAHRFDDFIRRLWEFVQSMPAYRGKTTFVISTDHGRGSGPEEWKNHSATTEGAEGIWIAVIGPDTHPRGERTAATPLTQSQIASTLAALVGLDYRAAFPQAAPPIMDVVGNSRDAGRAGPTRR